MATEYILALLISERDKLSRAIDALGAPMKRRGRPRKNAKAAEDAAPTAVASPAPMRKRKPMASARKKALSLKMKAAWARRRKQAKA